MTTQEVMDELEASAPLFPGYKAPPQDAAQRLVLAEADLRAIELKLRRICERLPEDAPWDLRLNLAIVHKDAQAALEGLSK
jgi:hypothetical protein